MGSVRLLLTKKAINVSSKSFHRLVINYYQLDLQISHGRNEWKWGREYQWWLINCWNIQEDWYVFIFIGGQVSWNLMYPENIPGISWSQLNGKIVILDYCLRHLWVLHEEVPVVESILWEQLTQKNNTVRLGLISAIEQSVGNFQFPPM